MGHARVSGIFNRRELKEHREDFYALFALFAVIREAGMDMRSLCDRVRQISYDIHVYHGHGHLEKVYENALVHRLCKAGMNVQQQYPITVYDEDGTLIGDYIADVLLEGELIVELKTAKTIAPEHEAQILGYLKSSRLEHGLLINFGSYRFEIRKFAWNPSLTARNAESAEKGR
jgi:GxxExxY protein